jgi:hypothetical protein
VSTSEPADRSAPVADAKAKCATRPAFSLSVGAVATAAGAALIWFGYRYFAG